jgi:hypothetical protein
MAKSAPELTIETMEEKIGYRIPDTDQAFQRFYTDLRPVPASRYERTKKEFSEFMRRRSSKPRCKHSASLLLEPGDEVVSAATLQSPLTLSHYICRLLDFLVTNW